MNVNPKILVAASDLMSRLDSSGTLSLSGVDIRKDGSKYMVKDAELPRAAVEAIVLDALGADASILDDASCKRLLVDEKLSFLGLEGQPPGVIALFVRRAENLAAKMADFSGYKLDGKSPTGTPQFDKTIKLPMLIKGIATKGVFFTRKVEATRAYHVFVLSTLEYDLNYIGFWPNNLKPGDPMLINQRSIQRFWVRYDDYVRDELIESMTDSGEVVYRKDNYGQDCRSHVAFKEHDFLRLLAGDAIARGGDPSDLPELFESISLRTVKDKLGVKVNAMGGPPSG